jgi:uncharacterized protein (DUF2147 family)
VVTAPPAPQPAPVQPVPAPVAPPVLAAAPPAAVSPLENKPLENKPAVENTSATRPLSPAVTAPDPQQNPLPAPPVVETPATAAPSAPPVLTSQETDGVEPNSPLGDWQTEGKNSALVHIEACGQALCGYVLDAATGAKGESLLVNMKPKDNAQSDLQWSGDVYSRTSGNSYYGTITLKQAGTLRVEACALGRFLCSGNDWTRAPKPDGVTASRTAADPRS